jgi:hypothetical protein
MPIHACLKIPMLVLFTFAYSYSQDTHRDSVCIGEAFIVPADSFYNSNAIREKQLFPSYVEFAISDSQGGHLAISLHDTQGSEILAKNFTTLIPNKYILSFGDVHCPGVYFVRVIFDRSSFIRPVLLHQTSLQSVITEELRSHPETTIADGAWKQSYTQAERPIMIPEDDKQVPDTVTNDVILEFQKGTYHISWTRRERTGGIERDKYGGTFLLIQDTIKLIDVQTGTISRRYWFFLHSDSLQLVGIGKNGGRIGTLLDDYPGRRAMALDGMYVRMNSKK